MSGGVDTLRFSAVGNGLFPGAKARENIWNVVPNSSEVTYD